MRWNANGLSYAGAGTMLEYFRAAAPQAFKLFPSTVVSDFIEKIIYLRIIRKDRGVKIRCKSKPGSI